MTTIEFIDKLCEIIREQSVLIEELMNRLENLSAVDEEDRKSKEKIQNETEKLL